MMSDRNIAERMRVEHEKVFELADALRERVAVVPRSNLGSWIKDMQERFDHFRAHMVKKMALEECEGYMLHVLERRPALAAEVDKLKHEHAELLNIMDGIHHAVADLNSKDRLRIRDCCHRIENVLSYIEHHETAETMLVTFVFTHDIGTPD